MSTVHSSLPLDTPNLPATVMRIPVDPEHSGIRMAGCGTLILGFGVSVVVISQFGLQWVLTGILSIIVAVALTYVVDRFLRERWESGRYLAATPEQIAIQQHGTTEREIDPQKQVNVLSWRFTVPRSGRVKKGWYVVAMSLEQDGEYIPVYTFMSPDDFEAFKLGERFRLLERKRRKIRKDSEREMRVAGEQRRLMDAERDRGIYGAEMTAEQFTQFIGYLQQTYPQWMIQR